MSEAADEIQAEEIAPEQLLPSIGKAASKIDGRGPGDFVVFALHQRWHGEIIPARCLLPE
jgi:hypothetical protein